MRLALRVREVPIPAHKVGAFGEKGVSGFGGVGGNRMWGATQVTLIRVFFLGNLRVFLFNFFGILEFLVYLLRKDTKFVRKKAHCFGIPFNLI